VPPARRVRFRPGALPNGITVRGDYAIGRFDGGAADNGFSVDAVQFGFRFPAPLQGRVIRFGVAPPAQCPGTAANPEAQPGNLCVYEGSESGAGLLGVYNSAAVEGLTDLDGAVLRVLSSVDGAVFYSIGRWAATSGPTAPAIAAAEGKSFASNR